MPFPNAVEVHPQRKAILQALSQGQSQAKVARQFNLSKFVLSRFARSRGATVENYKAMLEIEGEPSEESLEPEVLPPAAEPVALQTVDRVATDVATLQVSLEGKKHQADASQFIARANDRRMRAERRFRVRKLPAQDFVRLANMARDEDTLAAKLAGLLEPSGAAAVTNITINAGAVLMPVVTAPAGRSRIAPVDPTD